MSSKDQAVSHTFLLSLVPGLMKRGAQGMDTDSSRPFRGLPPTNFYILVTGVFLTSSTFVILLLALNILLLSPDKNSGLDSEDDVAIVKRDI